MKAHNTPALCRALGGISPPHCSLITIQEKPDLKFPVAHMPFFGQRAKQGNRKSLEMGRGNRLILQAEL